MARRQTDSKRQRVNRAPITSASLPGFECFLIRREIWGLMLSAIGAITLIALTSSDQGELSRRWALVLRQVFGIGAYPVAALMLVGGIVLLLWNNLEPYLSPRWQTLVGWESIFFAGLGLVHLFGQGSPAEMAWAGSHGGFIGFALWKLLVPFFGKPISIILLTLWACLGIYLVIGIPWRVLSWYARWAWAQTGMRLRAAILERRRLAELKPWPAPAKAPKVEPMPPVRARPAQPTPAVPKRRPVSSRPSSESSGATAPAAKEAKAVAMALPPLDLLAADEAGDTDDADARHKAQVIEETLEAFGIPAQVVEWSRGPVVTQFGVEPGYLERIDRDGNTRRQKIRVSKILSLSNDLALALAASPIRIEAPVPGRPVVGIEVPNAAKALVGLRGVLESRAFEKLRSPLRIALGRDVSGEAVVADLTGMPHLLLAGATGSGKSVCLNAIICSLLFQCRPDELQLLLVDPKRVELTKYNGIPHLIAPVVVDVEKVIIALRWLTGEMDRRYQELARLKARDIRTYNRKAKAAGRESLPYIVLVIDELADLMLVAPDDVERTICRLAQMARAVGIHLVVATQRPSVDVVTGLIKANFPARISFAVTSQVDSRVILDTPGAENLLGRGDMLYMAPDSPKLQRIQGCFVSDREIESLVNFWVAKVQEVKEVHQEEAPPWEGMATEEDSDEALLKAAAELVREHEHASASFLQRHLRIGYPRAARLIDQLEERGIVGPQESGGRSRTVLIGKEEKDSSVDLSEDE
ncbi:MAG: DNA translocase FtsK [Chloroflexi bacterium]|nr:DNA translocase FtsK [Chloroflexota bacterium]